MGGKNELQKVTWNGLGREEDSAGFRVQLILGIAGVLLVSKSLLALRDLLGQPLHFGL